jgi:hypothetical protein
MANSDTKPHWVTFVAEYKDGTKEYFRIDPGTLERGDHVARIIAREWQVEGKLKKDEINRVYRYWAAMQGVGGRFL